MIGRCCERPVMRPRREETATGEDAEEELSGLLLGCAVQEGCTPHRLVWMRVRRALANP